MNESEISRKVFELKNYLTIAPYMIAEYIREIHVIHVR